MKHPSLFDQIVTARHHYPPAENLTRAMRMVHR
jgi:hypothetical protein